MRFLPLLVVAAFAPLSYAYAQTKPPAKKTPAVSSSKAKKPTKSKLENQIDYLWNKSDEAFHDGDYPRAVRFHQAIVALDPTEVESYSLGAWLLWSLGKPAEAVAFIERGLKANPKDPDMWDDAGQHYDLQKRFADSARDFAKAVELSGPKADQMLRRRYAHATERAGDLSKSAGIWRALVVDFPDEAVNQNNLARVEKQRAEKIAPPMPTVVTLG